MTLEALEGLLAPQHIYLAIFTVEKSSIYIPIFFYNFFQMKKRNTILAALEIR